VSNEGRARIKHMTNRRANESVKKRLHKHWLGKAENWENYTNGVYASQ
jgi:hypothetical protein